MSAARKDFEIVLDGGTAVVYAKDSQAWREGMTREAVTRAQAMVGLLRRKQIGSCSRADVADVMVLELVDRLLTAARMLSDPSPHTESLEEELTNDVLGEDWCIGTLTVTGSVVAKGVEGDPTLVVKP